MDFEICKKVVEGNTTALADCPFLESLAGGILGSFIAFGILFVLLFAIAFYVYHAFSWYTIARKLKHKYPWLAWIPFAATAMRLQLGGFHWAWVFLYLIPLFGWIALIVLMVISLWRIFEKRKYPGWFGLSIIVPRIGGPIYLVIIGFVAFKDRKKMLFK